MSKDDVGYGKPPVHTRFKKGQSGNPAGRPKGKSSFKTISEVMADELLQEITVVEGGKKKKMMSIQALIRAHVHLAMKSPAAFKTLFALLEKYLPTHHSIEHMMRGRRPFELTPEDLKELTEERLLKGVAEHVTVIPRRHAAALDEVLEPGDELPDGTAGESEKM